MAQPTASPFPADALGANRAGMLTDHQRQSLIGWVRATRGNNLATAAVVGVIGVLMLTSRSFAYGAEWRPVLAVAAFAVAAALVLSHFGVFSRVLKDARAGRVDSIEGAIAKDRWVNQESAQTGNCYVQVSGRAFVTSYASYHALPDAGFVRLYYLPRSRRVVNLELLDAPLPEGALDSPAALGGLLRDSISWNGTKAAEARARLAGLHSALAQSLPPAGAPPPPHDRDPRPLAEAILGTWRGGGFGVSFAPDGTVTARVPVMGDRRGRWSVDAAGRLRMDALGGEQTTEAWVSGNTLTVSLEGRMLAFQRV